MRIHGFSRSVAPFPLLLWKNGCFDFFIFVYYAFFDQNVPKGPDFHGHSTSDDMSYLIAILQVSAHFSCHPTLQNISPHTQHIKSPFLTLFSIPFPTIIAATSQYPPSSVPKIPPPYLSLRLPPHLRLKSIHPSEILRFKYPSLNTHSITESDFISIFQGGKSFLSVLDYRVNFL